MGRPTLKELSLTATKKGVQLGENIVSVQVVEEEDSPVPAGLVDIKILKKFTDPATHKVVVMVQIPSTRNCCRGSFLNK